MLEGVSEYGRSPACDGCSLATVRGQVNKLARRSRIEGIGPFHCEAGFADLGRIRWGDAGELRTNVVDDVEVAVRPVVIPQAQIGADCLRV